MAEKKRSVKAIENQLRALEEALTDPLIVYGADGAVAEVNKPFLQELGWSENDVVGRSMPYIHESRKARAVKVLESGLSGKPFRHSTVAVAKTGERFEAELTGRPFSTSAGDAFGLVVVLRGTVPTAPRRPEKPPAQTEKPPVTDTPDLLAAFGDLFDVGPLGLAVFDVSGTHFAATDGFARMLGRRRGDLKPSLEWMNFTPDKWKSRGQEGWKRVPASANFRDHDVDYQRAGIEVASLAVCGGVLDKSDASNPTVFILAWDITGRKRESLKLESANDRLMDRLARLSEKLHTTDSELRAAKKEARESGKNLKRMNDALNKLIVEFQEEKRSFEDRIVKNFQLTTEPIIEQLKTLDLSRAQGHLVDRLDYSVRHLTSYFGINVSRKEGRLSQREIEICQLIQQGFDSRQIADKVGLSYQTIIVHRKNIRRKLGIKKSKQNLATYIQENM